MTTDRGTVVAATNATAVARRVLTTALALAEMAQCQVLAVHVVDGPTEAVESMAAHAGIPLRQLSGPPGPALLEATEADSVFGTVLGTHERPVPSPIVGSIARYLLERTTKPVVVVPPLADPPIAFKRLLVPLEGSAISTEPVFRVLSPLLGADVEVVVLHVFTEDTLPRMLDRPYRDLELLGREFLAYHWPTATRIEMRAGPVAASVVEVAHQERSQLVVLSWRQEVAEGRAQVLRDVLRFSALPVMVLPASERSRGAAEEARAS